MTIKQRKLVLSGIVGAAVFGTTLAIAIPLALRKKSEGDLNKVGNFITSKIIDSKDDAQAKTNIKELFSYATTEDGAGAVSYTDDNIKNVAEQFATFLTNQKNNFTFIANKEDGITETLLLAKQEIVVPKANAYIEPIVGIHKMVANIGAIYDEKVPKTNVMNNNISTWAQTEVTKRKVAYGISIKTIENANNNSIYSITGINGSKTAPAVETFGTVGKNQFFTLKDKGYLSLYKAIEIVSRDKSKFVITSDPNKKPSSIEIDDVLKVIGINEQVNGEDNPVFEFAKTELENKFDNDDAKNYYKISADGNPPTTLVVELSFLGNYFKKSIPGFKDNTAADPAKAVADFKKATNKTLPAAKNTVNKLTVESVPSWNTVNDLLNLSVISEDVTVETKVTASELTTATIELTFVSKDDASVGDTSTLIINGFVSQGDVDVEKVTTEQIISAITPAPSESANANSYTLQPTVTVNDFVFTLTKGEVDNDAGTIKFTYQALQNGNSTLTKESSTKAGLLEGFKTNLTDAQKKDKAKEYLSGLNGTFAITGVSGIEPKNATSANLTGLKTVQGANPTFSASSTSTGDGTATFNVKYTYGTEFAQADITFTGFKSSADIAIEEDNTKLNGYGSKDLGGKVNTFAKDATPTEEEINTFAGSGNELPAITEGQGVSRTFKVTSETNAKTVTIEASSNKTPGVPKTATLTFTNLTTQADNDVKGISTNITDHIKGELNPDKETDIPGGTVAPAEFDITKGKTTFAVTTSGSAVNKNTGSLTFNFLVTAEGLSDDNTDATGTDIVLSGWKTNETAEQKSTAIQTELDLIDKTFTSGLSDIAPRDFTEDNAASLFDSLVKDKKGAKPVYTLGTIGNGTIGNGTIEVVITYNTVGTNPSDTSSATVTITVGGLKSDEEIAKEEANTDIKTVSDSLRAGSTLTVDNKDGLAAETGKSVTSGDNNQFGITFTAVDNVNVTYSHEGITSDGDLTLNVNISKGTGTAKDKSFTVAVSGINAAKKKFDDTNAVNAVTAANLNLPAAGTDKLASSVSQPANSTTSSGVAYTYNEWSQDDTKGEISWKVNLTKGTGDAKDLTGTITGFGIKVEIPTAANITGTTADKDGLTIAAPKVTVNNVDVTINSPANAGEKTTTGSAVPKDGFLFPNGTKGPETITGIAVNQTAFDAAAAKPAATT